MSGLMRAAIFYCCVLFAGALPARAAILERVDAANVSAPSVVPSLSAPLAASVFSADAVAPRISAAAPSLTAAPVALPAQAAPMPLPAPLINVASIAPAPARERAGVPSAREVLSVLSAPEARPYSGRAFDGALASASDGVEPVRVFTNPAAGPRLAPSSPLRSAPGRILRGAVAGVAAATLAPLLWSAVPTSGALMLFAVAAAPVAAAAAVWGTIRAALWAYRRLAGVAAPAAAPPSPRRSFALRTAGFALGIALTAAVAHNQGALVEKFHSALDSRRPVAERQFRTQIPGNYFGSETARALSHSPEGRAALDGVRGRDGSPRMPAFFVAGPRQPVVALPGRTFPDAIAALLSRSAEGREVLEGLRDRGGVIRMPAFFISDQDGSAARYTPPDAIFLSVRTIEAGGVTVERFLRDPAAQAAYLEREQAILVHELKHADQARRSPFNADTRALLRTNGARLIAALRAYAFPVPAARPSPIASPAADPPVRSEPSDLSAAPVTIDAAEVERSGSTVERFLYDGAAQKKYIQDHRAELARALRSVPAAAPAARISAPTAAAAKAPFRFELGMIQEWEYEAYFTEHFYTDERLRADPAAEMSAGELANYAGSLMEFDEFLNSIDGYRIYAANFHGASPYYARYMADMRARWNAHLVDAHVLLARRAAALHDPAGARSQLRQARAVAAQHGLPAPLFNVPAR
ncbi:MAG: hypothetical protein ACHQ51_10730 [Elusimicrobiota bacterium]